MSGEDDDRDGTRPDWPEFAWCYLCGLEDVAVPYRQCKGCAVWLDRWMPLTPSQRQAELHAMDDYASGYEGGQ